MYQEETLERIRIEQDLKYTRREILTAKCLGDLSFRRDYRTRYADVVGSMYRGISSLEMVIGLAQGGIFEFFGTGGLKPDQVEDAFQRNQTLLFATQPYGMSLLRDEVHHRFATHV